MAKKINQVINGHEYYRTRLKIGVDRNGKPIYKPFYGRNKTEAELLKAEYKKNLNLGISEAGKQMILEVAMEEWLLDTVRPSLKKASTFQKYYEDFNNYIKGYPLGRIPLQSIRATHIQKHLNDFATTKTTNKIRTVYRYIKRYLEHALATALIARTPITGVIIPNGLETPHRPTEDDYEEPFSREEREQIINHARKKNPMYGDVIYLLFKLGARRGEILGLQEKHIDFNEGTLDIQCALSKVKQFGNDGESQGYVFELGDPKNYHSKRINYIDDEIKKTLKRAILRQKELSLKLGNIYHNDLRLIFTSDSGNPIDPKNLWEFWGRILRELNIPYRKMHSTRSTFVTECYEKDISEPITQKIIGHGPGSVITQRVYRKVRNRSFKESMLKAIQN